MGIRYGAGRELQVVDSTTERAVYRFMAGEWLPLFHVYLWEDGEGWKHAPSGPVFFEANSHGDAVWQAVVSAVRWAPDWDEYVWEMYDNQHSRYLDYDKWTRFVR